jgi:putative ABC transport system substrate-binding protein
MKLRDFLTLTAAIAWPLVAHAQEPRRVIGFLSSVSAEGYVPGVRAVSFQKDTGFVEGRNIDIEHRSAEGHYDRLPSLATELVSHDVAVIVCGDPPAAFAAKAASKTISIVFLTGADPVKLGLVDSFSRPGGNVSGVSVLLSLLGPKRLELLRELLPPAKALVLLLNPSNPNVRADVLRHRRRRTLSGYT